MQKFSFKVAILLLTFSLGVAAVSVFVFRSIAKQHDSFPDETNIMVNQGESSAPATNGETLEMVFVLDTTGSMGGLIEGAKQKIWSIVNEVMQKQSRPAVRVGLVAYRDKSDAYVTQILPLTEDLDKVYSTLMQYQAGGGGDTPENVRRALAEGVKNAGWSKSKNGVAQIIFLVGDAPPQNYQEEPDVLVTTAEAVRKNMIVNTIQCGLAPETQRVWQEIARRGEGKYFAIAQDGGVQTISTPFDAKLAELGNKLGATYLAYGGGRGAAGDTFRREKAEKQAQMEAMMSTETSTTVQADRAYNKMLNSAAYLGDLLQDLENGKIKIENIKVEDLPEDLRKLPDDERRKQIERRLEERKKMREEIAALSKQRSEFLANERKKSGKQDGFDAAVATALKEQLARRGIK